MSLIGLHSPQLDASNAKLSDNFDCPPADGWFTPSTPIQSGFFLISDLRDFFFGRILRQQWISILCVYIMSFHLFRQHYIWKGWVDEYIEFFFLISRFFYMNLEILVVCLSFISWERTYRSKHVGWLKLLWKLELFPHIWSVEYQFPSSNGQKRDLEVSRKYLINRPIFESSFSRHLFYLGFFSKFLIECKSSIFWHFWYKYFKRMEMKRWNVRRKYIYFHYASP